MTIEEMLSELYDCVEGVKTMFESFTDSHQSFADYKPRDWEQCDGIMRVAPIILARARDIIADLQLTCEKNGLSDTECLKA